MAHPMDRTTGLAWWFGLHSDLQRLANLGRLKFKISLCRYVASL